MAVIVVGGVNVLRATREAGKCGRPGFGEAASDGGQVERQFLVELQNIRPRLVLSSTRG